MNRLAGKTAVVTGGGSGIGLASARRFIEEGAFVYIFGRRQKMLDAALATLGNSARAVRGSVSDPADLDRLYATVKAERGGLDILFANAGTGAFAALGAITPEHYDQAFDVNVKGLLFTVQKGLPLMKAGGSIILTGSTTGEMGTPQFSVYSATKAAVRSFARCWTTDLKHRKIRVNVLSPGPTETPIFTKGDGTQQQRDEFKASLVAGVPLGRIGTPDEVAKAAVFLASDDSSYVTGIELFYGGAAQVE
jgi:NAD(P)-dependent dehydrogenase (short-subunit alcohol dehydrogenase family)